MAHSAFWRRSWPFPVNFCRTSVCVNKILSPSVSQYKPCSRMKNPQFRQSWHLTAYATSNKSPYVIEPQFPHQKNGNNQNTYFPG